MKLLIMGPQGSGKGTAAEKLSEMYNIPTISMGDLFRGEAASGSKLGKQVKSLIDAGSLVPDDITVDVLKARLNRQDCKNGYILDGFPRTMQQAILLNKITHIDKVLFLDADTDVVLARLTGRRTCPKCGHIHNIAFKGNPDYCSKCGTKYIIRDDDTPAAIKRRLNLFAEQTLPLVDYYKSQGKVLLVSANETPEHTLKQIIKGLGE